MTQKGWLAVEIYAVRERRILDKRSRGAMSVCDESKFVGNSRKVSGLMMLLWAGRQSQQGLCRLSNAARCPSLQR